MIIMDVIQRFNLNKNCSKYKNCLFTVDAGAATFLIVIFLGSEAREETATGIAVAYSIPPAAETVVN